MQIILQLIFLLVCLTGRARKGIIHIHIQEPVTSQWTYLVLWLVKQQTNQITACT